MPVDVELVGAVLVLAVEMDDDVLAGGTRRRDVSDAVTGVTAGLGRVAADALGPGQALLWEDSAWKPAPIFGTVGWLTRRLVGHPAEAEEYVLAAFARKCSRARGGSGEHEPSASPIQW